MEKKITKITTTRTEIVLDDAEIERVLLGYFNLEGGHIVFDYDMGLVSGATIYGVLEEEEDLS